MRRTLVRSDIWTWPAIITPPPPPDRGAEYCDERVCVSLCVFVCPRSYLRNTRPIFTNILFMRVTCPIPRLGPILWRRSDTLRISGFMDDVIFAHKLRLLDVAAMQAEAVRLTRSLGLGA